MMKSISIQLLFAFCSTTFMGSAISAEKLPSDFQKFVQDRDFCDHMRGEYPDFDPEHPEDMDTAIAAIEKACKGTDARLTALKIKYAKKPAMMSKLNEYESDIEALPD